jgi:purine-binding chemotaxis protein CheW
MTTLLFQLCGFRYALPAESVVEVFLLPALTPVAQSDGCVAGMINLRGRVLPVVDLRELIGVPRTQFELSESVIVVWLPEGEVGVLVSGVEGVRTLAPEAVRETPASLRARQALPTAHAVEIEGELALMLPVEQLRELLSDPPVASPGTGTPDAVPASFATRVDPEDAPIFLERARGLMREVETDEPLGLKPLAVVRLGQEYLGVPLDAVREFVPLPEVSRVPCTPPHVVGLGNLRGEILTLLDVRGSIGIAAPRSDGGGSAIVADVAGGIAGIIVDEVVDVIYTDPAQHSGLTPTLRAASDERITGAVEYAGRTVGVLDLTGLLADERLRVRDES